MTIAQVINNGAVPSRKARLAGRTDLAKQAWLASQSAARFALLPWVMVARERNLRTASARWRRQRGLPITPCATPRQARKRRSN